MTASEFLREISKEQLTSREFLALIGHTEISNEDYSEIKNNPAMTFERLAEILENSAVTGEDYSKLIKTARQRKEMQAQKKKREELENRLADALSADKAEWEVEEAVILAPAPEPVSAPVPYSASDATEEINIDLLGEISETDDVASYHDHDTTVEDLWGDSGGFEVGSDSAETDEYGSGQDFDRSAHRENMPKVVICLALSVALMFLSFGIRYWKTGSWGISDYESKGLSSYDELYELVSGKKARPVEAPSALYRAGRFTEPINPLTSVAASERFLFKVVENDIRAVEFDSGVMSDAPSFALSPELTDLEIVGIFERNNALYAVYATSAESIAMPRVAVYAFGSQDFTGVPDFEYVMSGKFKEIILRDNGFFIVGGYTPVAEAVAEERDGYVPYYAVNGERADISLDNTVAVGDSEYSDMTVIGSVSGDGFEMYAVSGNSADCVYHGGGSLIMSFYSKKKDESRILRYKVSGGKLTNPLWGSVSGKVGRGFIDESTGSVRVVTDLGDSAALYVFSADMNFIARSGNVPLDGSVAGAAFDAKAAYVVAGEPAKVYGIGTDGNKPTFLNEPDALVSDKEFYAWGNDRFFSVETELDAQGEVGGVTVVMYRQEGQSSEVSKSKPVEEARYRLPLPDDVWLRSGSRGFDREKVAANRESGVIIFPVIYFNAVARVDCFFALGYSEGQGENSFFDAGKITEIGVKTKNHAVVIRGGYIYTVWDDVVRSATTDLTMFGDFEF